MNLANGVRRTRIILDMIRFEHTIFALPFAYVGVLLATRAVGRVPHAATLLWILAAMVGARSAAMAVNRIVDARIDSVNPRTMQRAIPAGLITQAQAVAFTIVAIALFEFACLQLNRTCLILSPIALALMIGYSYTKRFTPACHLSLGAATGLAPAGGWIAVTGQTGPVPALLWLAVGMWIGGFDIIYSLQDVEFDRDHGLHSLPAWLGAARALVISRLAHLVSVAAFAAAGLLAGAHHFYFVGLALAAALLTYEQSIVRPPDLSRVNTAFFTLNGWVSVVFFVFAMIDRLAA